jgi:beta-fructofuranosidase
MYNDFGGIHQTMGDVDVLFVDGVYHLFHLVLPNHDFIAHSISHDGIYWERVHNAVFIGHPGNWDDSMLWTVHVSRDPHDSAQWRMFYTGLARRDRQLKQRIGLATSRDLLTWTKSPTRWRIPALQTIDPASFTDSASIAQAYDPNSPFPIEATPEHYESSLDDGRKWVSWRDPFHFQYANKSWLLCSARVHHGPLIRRGCVGLLEEVEPYRFADRPPIFHPGLYDDIEVPNLIELDNHLYLIGSIREDAKIRYWHSQSLHGPWESHYDNVLLPRGNYAARISRDAQGWLIWNFFSRTANRKTNNVMPPPKRLVRQPDGLLHSRSFEAFDRRVVENCEISGLKPIESGQTAGQSPTSISPRWRTNSLLLVNEAGHQIFVFPQNLSCFRLRAKLRLIGMGKCGMVARLDRDSRDGYYLSLDLSKGIAQLRAWGTNCQATGDEMMNFRTVQSAYWNNRPGIADLELLAFGSYLECSIDGRVVLSLVDEVYREGAAGFYLESARAHLHDISLERLAPPEQHDDELTVG